MKLLVVLSVYVVVVASASFSEMFRLEKKAVWEKGVYRQEPVYCYDSSSGQDELCEMMEGKGAPHNQRSLACFTVFSPDMAISKSGCWEQQHISLSMCTESCDPVTASSSDPFCCCFGNYCNSPTHA